MVRNYGWENGALLLARRMRAQGRPDDSHGGTDDLAVLTNRYLRSADLEEGETQGLVAGIWPGSSLVVFDACKVARVRCQMHLFDISLAVIANLRGVFRESDCTVVGSPASADSPLVRGADLLFIDPPGIRSPQDRSAPSWKSVAELARASVQACLLWLPVMGLERGGGESPESTSWRAELIAEGWKSTCVIWQPSGRGMIGTQLIWRLPAEAGARLKNVVQNLCALGLGWLDDKKDPVP
jgi:hypothetical protein